MRAHASLQPSACIKHQLDSTNAIYTTSFQRAISKKIMPEDIKLQPEDHREYHDNTGGNNVGIGELADLPECTIGLNLKYSHRSYKLARTKVLNIIQSSKHGCPFCKLILDGLEHCNLAKENVEIRWKRSWDEYIEVYVTGEDGKEEAIMLDFFYPASKFGELRTTGGHLSVAVNVNTLEL